MGGQCFDELLNDYPELKDNDVFMETYDLWNKYHLNNMHAGTPAQEAAIKKWEGAGHNYEYAVVCEYLKSINLYEVPVATIDINANPQYKDKQKETYRYGQSWLKEMIPQRDIERIENLITFGYIKEPSIEPPEIDMEM